MDLNKETIKKLRGLILFTALVVVAFVNYQMIIQCILFIWDIIFPFILGAAMAFIINVPMQFIERVLFEKPKQKQRKWAVRLARPISLLLSLLLLVAVVLLVIFVVMPELGNTFINLSNTISDFVPTLQEYINEFFSSNALTMDWSKTLDFDWNHIVNSVVNFVRNGAGDVLSSTYTIAKSLVSGVTTFFIGFVFACYIVLQKEKLSIQIEKVFYALFKKNTVNNILKVSSLCYKTFRNFLTGQCVEAIILGIMFFVTMSIFRFPYALLVGILIAFTALIPIFGAFIGCIIGTFLILMVNPLQALGFIVLFLILQQIEGNFIYPHVVGSSVGLPSIWVLVAVSVGASLMGVIGMLIFIPATSVIYTLFREFIYYRLEYKNKVDKSASTP